RRLEAIVHPLVGQMRQDFLAEAERRGAPFVTLDIPLLFAGGGGHRVDKGTVASAPAEVQRARGLARPALREQDFAASLARQVPDAEKRRRADFVVDTGIPLAQTEEQVRRIAAQLGELAKGKSGDA